MARSTKTKHVMNLVGAEPVKKPMRPPKAVASATAQAPAEKVEKTPSVSPVHEPVQPLEPEITEEKKPVEPAEETAHEEPAPEPVQEEREPVHKARITAIVCELINQELGSVAERFHLKLTDSNLWVLTRAALEEVRPEFAADSEDREEKLERLRPQVIGAMAKVAIKLAAKDRNN